MARGIEGRTIFRDDRDRADFVGRLAALAEAGAFTLYAWALLPNHFHLLVRTRGRPLPRAMRSLLTGYAGAFNRRHRRKGHLFQNRYKSIVVEEEPHFLELVRYLHLNPLRAGIVDGLRSLDRYPWSGHAALSGHRTTRWQATEAVLARFGGTRRRALTRYRAFVAEGAKQGRRPELQGGGLVRSAGGWAAVRALRRGREAYAVDERILGGSDFVERIRRESEAARPARTQSVPLPELIAAVCRATGLAPEALRGGGRRPALSRSREGLSYLWVEVLGRSGRQLAEALGIRPESVYKAARRGAIGGAEWRRLAKGLP
jgi:REP element-mobilizing transposase RayT